MRGNLGKSFVIPQSPAHARDTSRLGVSLRFCRGSRRHRGASSAAATWHGVDPATGMTTPGADSQPSFGPSNRLPQRDSITETRQGFPLGPALATPAKQAATSGETLPKPERSTLSAPSGSPTLTTPTDLHWRDLYDQLETAIKVRQSSAKTLKSYRAWTRQLHGMLKSPTPVIACFQHPDCRLANLLNYLTGQVNPPPLWSLNASGAIF